ncbi:hypothetical protein AWC38_SpisGene690 [Stylophora pistillata]|uniref:Uncharacterized protein n=1 Tax=Stylophora pistillata TaxID=50429 RepID=A0A2B4SZD3_STYPI|nr:hypothetical protein AWC38_SpisGene690 [Stylophora pistillata]
MRQLWEDEGYEHLGIRSQNLRDQASRLEKMEHSSTGKVKDDGVLGCDREREDLKAIDVISKQEFEPRNQRSGGQNFNFEEASQIDPRYANYATKPCSKSKAEEPQELLSKRLVQWKDGEIIKLLREGRIIRSRIGKLRSIDPPDKSKVFTKLVLEGQINSALRFLSESTSGGVLPLTDEVMPQLQQKHPSPQPAKLGSLLLGPIDDEFPESVYSGINGETFRQATLRTKDPSTIEPLLASRLIPLDKGEGAVRPIGVGEVIRRVCGKCVMNIAKRDVVEESGSLQLCAGQKSGSDAAIHGITLPTFQADGKTLFDIHRFHILFRDDGTLGVAIFKILALMPSASVAL